ncbi:hypothetical protein C8J57DRAFT_955651, partial [Mycena rebaudengoi]
GEAPEMYRVSEMLPEDVLSKIYSGPEPVFPGEVVNFDAFILCVPICSDTSPG